LLDRSIALPDGDGSESGDDSQDDSSNGGSAKQATTISSPLAAQFRIRHISHYPLLIEHARVTKVPNVQIGARHSRDAGQTKKADQRIRVII
jgi:hypothetical protein